MTVLERTTLDTLRATLRGTLITEQDDSYQAARQVYNGMIQRYPKLIAQCVDVADVISVVDYARENHILLSVRGGGHNAAGLGVGDDSICIDLSGMKGIRVDAQGKTARVQGGCTWGDVDHATHAFGLATPSGIHSTTGVGGLTLGGGHGYLTRKYGLTIDNLLSADVVLADGSRVTASKDENRDLFWAIRGGGGNFGVVTSFLLKLHPVSLVIGGPTLWPMDKAAAVMRWYDTLMKGAPRDLYGFFAFMTVPPAAPFPPELHGKKMCGVVWCYLGTPDQADAIFAPVRQFGPPALHGVQAMPYPVLQSAFDALYPKGLQWYWKADFVRELSDEAIQAHVHYGARMPTLHSGMHLYPINGAVHDVGQDETAFSYRDVRYSMVIVGVDPDPAKRDPITAWARAYWEAVHPYSAGGAYVNFMMSEGAERVRATYRDNYERLAAIKRQYDPDNLFRSNQNIKPESEGEGNESTSGQ